MTWLAHRWLEWRGWRFIGEMPDLDKMIIIGAPHTSNWDFILFLAAIRHWRISPRFVGKHTLFRWPFGWFFRKLGGIPVDRSRPGGMVGQVTEEFEEVEQMILVVAPEGTRKEAPFWKSGFVRIAAEAKVPILPAYIHFPRKEVVLGTLIDYEGDEKSLMDRLRSFYEAGEGKGGKGKGSVRLKEERSV
ncbi:MAG: lysophospholipid acyltransferase family protein [Acidimicrobiia bacterium]